MQPKPSSDHRPSLAAMSSRALGTRASNQAPHSATDLDEKMTMYPPDELNHIYWVGGSPCCGKSTIVDRLAAAHDMTVYRCDDAYYTHQRGIDPVRQPIFHRLTKADTDSVWLRPVQQQIDEELALYREEFPMILNDLKSMPADRPIIADGAALLPELLAVMGIHPRRMLWMVPTEPFQRKHYQNREWRHDILRDCSDPDLGWENWMARDAGFAKSVETQARKYGLTLITVDGARTLEENEQIVRDHFRLIPDEMLE